MKVPSSAADKQEVRPSGEIMVIVSGQKFMLTALDALSLCGVITVQLSRLMRNAQ